MDVILTSLGTVSNLSAFKIKGTNTTFYLLFCIGVKYDLLLREKRIQDFENVLLRKI